MTMKTTATFLLLITVTSALPNQYCQLTCDLVVQNYSHTVCDRQNEKCGPSRNCGSDFHPIKLRNNHRQYIVDLHNYLRNKVAVGNETRGQQPPASNMNMMAYNKELEFIAQCWANTCNGNPLIHDTCRRTNEYTHVGQNLGFINSSIADINLATTIKQLVMLWYNEVSFFDSQWVSDTKDRGSGFKVGHYTQMLWADSSEIGCAASFYTTLSSGKKWNHIIFVCNYGPGGNYLGLPVYSIGKPISNCPVGLKPNKQYRGLCGSTKRVTESKAKFNVFE